MQTIIHRAYKLLCLALLPVCLTDRPTAFKPALGELHKGTQLAPKFAYLTSKIRIVMRRGTSLSLDPYSEEGTPSHHTVTPTLLGALSASILARIRRLIPNLLILEPPLFGSPHFLINDPWGR